MTSEYVTLESLSHVITKGTTPTQKQGYTDDGINFIRALSIDENGQLDQDTFLKISDGTNNELKRSIVQEGDVLVTIAGVIGKVAIVENKHLPANLNQALAIIRPKKDHISSRYLANVLRSYDAQFYFGSRIVESVQANLSLSELGKFPVEDLTLEQQNKRNKVLELLEDILKIQSNITNSAQILISSIFQSWFIDFDPVKSKAEGKLPYGMDGETAALFPDSFEDSELGLIPIGWELSSVLDTANFINGAAYKSMHFCQPLDGLPVVKIAELKNGFTKQTQYTDSDLGDKYRLGIGDILFSWSGSPATSIDIFLWDKGDAWLNQHIFRVDSDSPISRTFNFALLKYLKTTLIWMATNRMTTGLGHVTKGDLQKLLFVDPPIKIKKKFHELIGPLLQEMENTQQNILLLSEIRDALLPRVMSGELKLN